MPGRWRAFCGLCGGGPLRKVLSVDGERVQVVCGECEATVTTMEREPESAVA